MRTVRAFLVVQAAIFGSAALLHTGAIIDGYADPAARTAETIIAVILVVGLLLSWSPTPWGRRAAISAQALSLLGTMIGLYFVLFLGPRLPLDVGYHVLMLIVLAAGLLVSARRSHG
jgi:hypothetical protein